MGRSAADAKGAAPGRKPAGAASLELLPRRLELLRRRLELLPRRSNCCGVGSGEVDGRLAGGSYPRCAAPVRGPESASPLPPLLVPPLPRRGERRSSTTSRSTIM